LATATADRLQVKVERHTTPPPGVVPYAPYGACEQLWYCRQLETLIEGPSRTGKSRSAIAYFHHLCLNIPGFRALFCRNTRESMTQSVMATYEQQVLPDPFAIPFNHQDSEYRYPNGSKIIVGGLDNPQKILSTEYDGIYICQAEETTWEQVKPLLTRLSGTAMEKKFGEGFRRIIYDVNPSDPGHWLNLRFPPEGQPDGDRIRLCSHHQDNPLLFDHAKGDWTDFGRSYMKTLDQLDGYQRLRLRDGIWAGAEGQYFEEWDPALHVCDPFEIPAYWTRFMGCDFGFADPCCYLWFARDESPDQWGRHPIYLYRELYQRKLRDTQQAAAVKLLSRGERITRRYADPSMFNKRTMDNRPSFAKMFAASRLPLIASTNDRILGGQKCHGVLAADNGRPPLFRVFRGAAPNFCRTLPIMVRDAIDPEKYADQVKGVKTEDHAVDAWRYAIVGMLGFHLKVQPAEVRFGYNRVA
jgi:phage terminase large subunit